MLTLESIIIRKYGRLADFAAEIGWTQKKLYRVLCNPKNISLSDIKLLSSKLNIHDNLMFYQVFFAN